MNCSQYSWSTREDAIDVAEQRGLTVDDEPCSCGVWHARQAESEEEAESAAESYRRELARKFPELAEQRGWRT